MQEYDGTQQFYSDDANRNLQLIEYGRLPSNAFYKTAATGTTYIDESNNQIVEIVGKDKSGNNLFKRYKLVDLKQFLKMPELQDIEGVDGNKIRLDPLTQELIGPSMFHASDYNIHTIETVINILLKNQAIQGQNETAIVDFFKQLTDDQLSEISTSISQLIDERYYSKEQVDEKLNDIQKQINNLNRSIDYKPAPNSVFAPGYTGEPDYNDQIDDPDVKSGIDTLSNDFSKDEEKGENN